MEEQKKYTKPTRFNLTLSYEQYKFLLARKRAAWERRERVSYKDLMQAWGIPQYFMATAMSRGIKQYDYRLWKEKQNAGRKADRCGSDLRPTS